MSWPSPQREIVLVGAGHTHLHVLRCWRTKPLAGTRLTCVSEYPVTTYSAMLPGTLAGLYSPGRMQIDLARLCADCGVGFIQSAATGLDPARRLVLLPDRPAVPFDVLSIGIGSVPQLPPTREPSSVLLTIKPMQTFLARLATSLSALLADDVGRARKIAVVGGGAGGVEIMFCLPAYLEQQCPGMSYQLILVDSGREILPGASSGAVWRARRELARRNVELSLDQGVRDLRGGRLIFDDRELPVDLAIWATGAVAPPALARMGLPTDGKGFLLTDNTLRTVGGGPVFVVGDSGSSVDNLAPKAGVIAVRQGPVLWKNLQRQLRGERLLAYVPQKHFLKLLNTGDGRAILDYKGLSVHAPWCWTLKDWIDRRFMAQFQIDP